MVAVGNSFFRSSVTARRNVGHAGAANVRQLANPERFERLAHGERDEARPYPFRDAVGAILDVMIMFYERNSLSAAATVMRRLQDLQPLAWTRPSEDWISYSPIARLRSVAKA